MAFAGENLKQIQHLLRSESSSLEHGETPANSNEEPVDSDEYTTADYPGILDSDLTSLTPAERGVFIAIVMVLLVLSLCGNISTLYVNFRRKIRPFFRACLISLAFSDLLNTIFLSVAYLSQYTAEYVQIWRLGPVLCSFVPFITTTAILASSMTLVGIALDRYFAVMKAVIGFWNPSVVCCFASMFGIWAASIGISCPVFCIYALYPVFILTEEDTGVPATPIAIFPIKSTGEPTATTTISSRSSVKPTTSSWALEASREDFSYTLVREQELVTMCVSDQKDVALYYVIVFAIIFIPCIVAFIWLNSIIAKKLWIRRHSTNMQKNKANAAKKSKLKMHNGTNIELMNAPTSGSGRPARQCAFSILRHPSCNCRSVHSTSTTMPSSLAMTMGGGPLQRSANAAPIQNNATKSTIRSNATSANNNVNSTRESRHIRMFTIILLMMAVFIFFRLPAWIFLVMRMYGSYSKPIHWIIFFSFGILNLASCVLNPLFYTFLTETIQYAMFVKVKLCDNVCGLRLCCGRQQRRNSQVLASVNYGGCQSNVAPPAESPLHSEKSCCCCAIGASLRYEPPQQSTHNPQQPQFASVEERVVQKEPRATNNDKDEGVECSDSSDDGNDFYDYNQRIYTIFPPSLVSSSVTSQ